LPEARYETERLRIGTDFEAPVCEGTLRLLDRSAERVLARVGQDPDDVYELHWLEDRLDEYCDPAHNGCYYPGTRIGFARGGSLMHELTHAAIDSPDEGFFLEEGIANMLGGGSVACSRGRRVGLEADLRTTRRQYRDHAVDYPKATHLVHYLRDREGNGAIERIVSALHRGIDGDGLVELLDETIGWPVSVLERGWQDDAPHRYPDPLLAELPELELDGSGAWIELDFDCDSPDTFGPRRDTLDGTYRLLRLALAPDERVRLSIIAEPGARLVVFDPTAESGHTDPAWWPDPGVDPEAVSLAPGHMHTLIGDGRPRLILLLPGPADRPIQLQAQRR
jgi:hypothetical protein